MVEIPFNSIAYEYREIVADLQKGIERLAKRSALVLGQEVDGFERDLARYLGCSETVGVGSGTDAILLALLALGLEEDDEVIIPGNICVAVMEALVRSGAAAVVADLDAENFALSLKEARKAVTPRTKAIILVHPYGMPADIQGFEALARSRDLTLIEACGQAFGARYRGRPVGGFGRIGCFSFNPDKVIGGLGDGGAVATNDEELASTIRKLRDHGRDGIGLPAGRVGFSSRLDAINALAVSLKLKHIDRWVGMRCEMGSLYRKRLQGTGLTFQNPGADSTPSYQMLAVLAPGDRCELSRKLKEAGVATDYHYLMAPHDMPAFKDCRCRKQGSLPVTEDLLNRVISLPFYTGMSQGELEWVTDTIKSVMQRSGSQ